MFISEELRKTNISEYLLYMWQVEDAVRAAGLDADRLFQSVSKNGGLTEADSMSWRNWYQELADMMRREGKQEKGHLQVNETVLSLLCDLHKRLLEADDRIPEYRESYYKALPYIVEFRARSKADGKDEIENCFDMLYGVWMLKLQKKQVSPATAQAVGAVSALIGKLAACYHKEKAGILEGVI